MSRPHILAVDLSNLVMRLYYRKSCTTPEQVVPHVLTALKGLVREYKATHLVIAVDGTNVFRYGVYPEYKGTRRAKDGERGPTPHEICAPVIEELTRLGYCLVQHDEFEADDCLATVARGAKAKGAVCSILSTDKDLWQLVEDGWVRVIYPESGGETILREQDVIARLGVPPRLVPQLKMMSGDKSDNILKMGEVKETAAGPKRYGFTVERAAELLTLHEDIGFLIQMAVDGLLPEKECRWLYDGDLRLQQLFTLTQLVDGVPMEISGDPAILS